MDHEAPAPAHEHGAGNFAPTRWSLVLQLQGGDPAAARRALEELCAAYWFPLYAWARRDGHSPADAADRVQAFFATILGQRLFERADASRGRLRTFLLTAFRRHLRDAFEKANAERRGGGRVVSFDAAEAEQWYLEEPAAPGNEELAFDRQWALTLLERALDRVRQAYERRGRGHEFQALQPFLTESGDAATYAEAGRAVGLAPGAFKVALHRLRDRFAEALRSEVRDTQSTDPAHTRDPDQAAEEELAHLLRALAS